MNIVWKIGVNAKANRLTGSAPGCAGLNGCCGVPDGPDAPGEPSEPPGTHAATTSPRRTRARGTIQRCRRRDVMPSIGGLANRVITAWVPGMASSDPSRAHPAALEEAVPLDRLLGIARAGRLEPARRGKESEHDAVEPDEPDPDALHVAVGPPSTPPRPSSRRNAPTSASWPASTTAGRAMMRTSQPGWNEGAITLSASRSRRLTRLRTTAPPSFRPVASPNRVVSRSVRRNRAARYVWDRLVPRAWNAAKSCGRESITSRGG